MENNNHNIETKVEKKKTSQAMKDSQKRYYNKKKDNEDFKEIRKAYSKKHYDNNKEKVIARVTNCQKRVLQFEQIERLHELKEQGLLNYESGKINDEEYEKYNKKLIGKLAHLHLT